MMIMKRMNQKDSAIILFVMTETKGGRFSFCFTSGNKDFENTIKVLFSCIAQSNLQGDLTKVIRRHLNEIVYIIQ